MENIFANVIDKCNGMTKDCKYLILLLVLDLENQIKIDTVQSKSTNTKRSGHVVIAPRKSCKKAQPKNHLLPTHEVISRKKLKVPEAHHGATSTVGIYWLVRDSSQHQNAQNSMCFLHLKSHDHNM